MIYAEDGATFSWDADQSDLKHGPTCPFYEFLSTIPLYAKKELFLSMSRVLDSHVFYDVFETAEQMQWAIGVLKLGLQLPLEDTSIISDAFKHYSNIVFILHRLRVKENGVIANEDARSKLLLWISVEALTRPITLFNPRRFFASDLPWQTLRCHAGKDGEKDGEKVAVVYTTLPEPRATTASPSFLANAKDSEPHPNSPTGDSGQQKLRVALSTTQSLRCASSVAGIDNAQQEQGPGPSLHHTQAEMRRKQDLWEKYVEFLTRVLQVYSTMMRGLRPMVSEDAMTSIFRAIMAVIDMILSQGGSNPRLVLWRTRYRDIIGGELWDRTWATLGDRLEIPAIKLLLDVWGRIINEHMVIKRNLLTHIEHWLHRDRFFEVWMLLTDQFSRRVLRVHYPHDKNAGIDRMHVQFAGFSMSTTSTDEDAIFILSAFTSTKVDFSKISGYSYFIYTCQVCKIIERILGIDKVVVVNGQQYGQKPPTANYVMHYFGDTLLSIALRDYTPSRDFASAKLRVITVLTRLLTLDEDPEDPFLPENRTRIIYALERIITRDTEVQTILPNVPMLLKNSMHIRAFIPQLFNLVTLVLPKERYTALVLDEQFLRHYAYEAVSVLIAYVGYYHRLGRSDLIDACDQKLAYNIDSQISTIIVNSGPPEKQKCLRNILEKIDSCMFTQEAQKDVILTKYLNFIFRMLLLSVVTEHSVENAQYVTGLLITFLYQYARYNPGYIEVFVQFYVDQLTFAKNDQMSTIYIYGLVQTAMIMWTDVLSRDQLGRVMAAVVDALAHCDQGLRRYTHWNTYHQVFITSMRCLVSWLSVMPQSSVIDPASLSKLTGLLNRTSSFIHSSRTEMPSVKRQQLGTRMQLTSSGIDSDRWARSVDSFEAMQMQTNTALPFLQPRSEGIMSFTMLGIFGKSAKIKDPEFGKSTPPKKVHILSESLYRVLYTTVSVFSTVMLRSTETVQMYTRHPPEDISLIRQAITHGILPSNSSVLWNCSPDITRYLKGYTPTSVRLFSTFRCSIYTAINFQRYEDGRWSVPIILTTSRYAGGSKQWLVFTEMPKSETPVTPDEDPSLLRPTVDPDLDPDSDLTQDRSKGQARSWIRLSKTMMYPEKIRKGLRFSDAHRRMKCVQTLVDDVSEQHIEKIIADDFQRLHDSRNRPDIPFPHAEPGRPQPRGDTFDRVRYKDFFCIDFSMLRASESILKDMDQLDDLDRPFSAYAGILYLQSPQSLSTERDVCKGPLRGISTDFAHFLCQLNRQQASPAKLLRGRTIFAAARYVFSIKGSKVCYNLAPNISALICGSKMKMGDNRLFYELLRERGIAIIWFDTHPGMLDKELAWEFIDRLGEDHAGAAGKYRGASSEYLQPGFPQTVPTDPSKHRCTGGPLYPQSPPPVSTVPRATSAAPTPMTPQQDVPEIRVKLDDKAADAPEQGGLLNKQVQVEPPSPSYTVDNTVRRYGSEPSARGTEKQCYFTQGNTSQDEDMGAHHRLAESVEAGTVPNPVHNSSNESMHAFLATYPSVPPQDRSEKKQQRSLADNPPPGDAGPNSQPAPKVRMLIAITPVVGTGGRLVKVSLSANGGSAELNRDFERMTGPLMSDMVVKTEDIAYMLSATILDAAANRASLQGEDFSMIYRRMEMIKTIIDRYTIKHASVSDAHKFMFPVGKSGVGNTVHINPGPH
ncbi:hypothetical protein GGF46_002249 [Coemansia sp. RSA 552]|nr:hypothetical protein GGF46_002249 [Coemansia sp. RSA 552]